MRTRIWNRTFGVRDRPPTDANPSPNPRGRTHYQAMRGDVRRDHCPGPDHRPGTEFDTTDDRCVRPDARSSTDVGRHDLPIVRSGSRVQVVRERDAGPHKDLLLESHSPKYGDVILDLAAVADNHLGVDIDGEADRTVRTDPAPRPDVCPVPDPRSLTNEDAVIDDGGGMYQRLGWHRGGSR